MIAGTVYDVGPAEGGRYSALVLLDGEDTPRQVDYWPELLAQWGADKLRRWLLVQANQQRADELAAAAAADAATSHARDLAGAGSAEPGEFEPKEAPEDHV